MLNTETTLQVFDAIEERRQQRRAFLRAAGGASAAVAGASLLAACGSDGDDDNGNVVVPTPTPTASNSAVDLQVLNFALNLEYLEANFYSFAVFGTQINESLRTGVGPQGQATGGRLVPFQDPVVRAYAREIAADEIAHVAFLRRTLGPATVAQPTIDVGVAPTGAFSSAARAAGIVTTPTGSFDPYADDNSFLLGAYIFEDVGVTAYKGASPLITNKSYLEAAAGILAVEAYHAGLVRTILNRKGLDPTALGYSPVLIERTEQISNARDSVDGADDRDQGIDPARAPANQPNARTGGSNIVPVDGNGLAFSRNVGQVLNIVYNTRTSVTAGGFFPNGVNGDLRTSGAN